MNPVLGLDVAKEESQVQAFLRRKEPYKKSFKSKHDMDGLFKLQEIYFELKEKAGSEDGGLEHYTLRLFKKSGN